LEQQAIREIQSIGGDVEVEVAAPEWLREFAGEARLENLRIFNRAKRVDLTGSDVTDEQLRAISGLKHIEYLSLCEAPITDAGLVHLSEVPRLVELHLDYTGITDAGLAHLDGCADLAILVLDDTAITDAGLLRLSKHRRLIYISAGRTALTESGKQAFYAALPSCQISPR
jgi:hypothetical protein